MKFAVLLVTVGFFIIVQSLIGDKASLHEIWLRIANRTDPNLVQTSPPPFMQQPSLPANSQQRDQPTKDSVIKSGEIEQAPPPKREAEKKSKKEIKSNHIPRSTSVDAPLLTLWTQEELRGEIGDEVIRPLKRPDHSPPEIREPQGGVRPLQESERLSIRRVRVSPGIQPPVALTFDLCEQADDVTGYDRGIVNTLRDQDVRATFFAGGKWLHSHPEKAMQLMADPRFEIGNHGWTHGNLRVLTGQRMVDQIVWTQAEYQRLWLLLADRAEQRGLGDAMRMPFQPQTLRFPYGTCSPESLQTANDLGLAAIQWDVVSGDAAKGQSPASMARRIIEQVKPGSIVVMHANGRGSGTAAALPTILEGLRARGFQFVTVSDLLQYGEPVTSNECYENRPGDNKKYDAMFGEGTE